MRSIQHLLHRYLRWDFSAFVIVFSAFTFLCVAFYTFEPSFKLGFYEVYTASLALAALLAAFASSPQASTANHKINWPDVGLGSLIFLFGLGLGLYRLDFFSIWLDEEVQAFSTRAWPGFSIVGRSVLSQQMPLGYFFTALNWDLAGASEWGLRLLACFFTAGSAVLFFRIARKICRSPLIYSAGPFIYLLNPWIIRYSQEGRPYGFMMFCCLLWLNSVHDLFFAGGEGRQIRLRRSFSVFACSLFFLLSASFQPLIFCASLACVAGTLMFSPAWKMKTGAFLGALGLAVLAVLPLIALARRASLSFLHPTERLHTLYGSLPSIWNFTNQARILFLEQSYFLALVFIFAPLTLNRPGKGEHGKIWAGMAACLLFGLFFHTAYSLLVDYPLFVRYFITLYPLGLLVILTYFDQMSSLFGGSRARLFRLGWQFFFIAAIAAPPLKALPEVYYSKKYDRWNVDFKSIYNYFRQTGWSGDVGYTVPILKPNEWEQTGFIGTDFYYRENAPVRVLSYRRNQLRETVSDLIVKDLSGPPPRQVFFTFLNLPDSEAASVSKYCSSAPRTELRAGDRFWVCKVSVNDGLAKTADRFFSGLVSSIADKEKAYRLYDILLRVAEFEGDLRRCRAHLSALKALNSEFEKTRQIIRFHEDRCGPSQNRPVGLAKSH